MHAHERDYLDSIPARHCRILIGVSIENGIELPVGDPDGLYSQVWLMP